MKLAQFPLLMQYGFSGVAVQSASVMQKTPTSFVTQSVSRTAPLSQWSTQKPVLPHAAPPQNVPVVHEGIVVVVVVVVVVVLVVGIVVVGQMSMTTPLGLVATAGCTQLLSTRFCGEPPSGHAPAFVRAAENFPCAFGTHTVSTGTLFAAAFE